jgi:hypothetical protein
LPAGRQHLHRDQAIGLEPVGRREVAHLAGAGARATQLDRDRVGRDVADREARGRAGRRDREPAALPAGDVDRGTRWRVQEIRGPAQTLARPASWYGPPVDRHDEAAGERQHDGLVLARCRSRSGHPPRASPLEGPRSASRRLPGSRTTDQPSFPSVPKGRWSPAPPSGHAEGLRSGFGTSASVTWWSSSWYEPMNVRNVRALGGNESNSSTPEAVRLVCPHESPGSGGSGRRRRPGRPGRPSAAGPRRPRR